MSETASKNPPRPDRSRRGRVQTQRAKSERNFRIFNMLKAGAPMTEIAGREGLSVRRARSLISAILASREIDPPPGFCRRRSGG